jgi:hypothetical protein
MRRSEKMTPEIQSVFAQICKAKGWTGRRKVPAELHNMLCRALDTVMFEGMSGHDGMESYDPIFPDNSDDFDEANDAVGFLANVVGTLILGAGVSIGKQDR